MNACSSTLRTATPTGVIFTQCRFPSSAGTGSEPGADERLGSTLWCPLTIGQRREKPGVRVQRLLDRPIISADLHPSIGSNIQGPSMIRVPDWIEGRLGNYYLYFADHKGRYVRLAYADNLLGPWRIHPPGSLQLGQSCFLTKPP